MPILRLVVERDSDSLNVSHLCHDAAGKPVYSPRTVSRKGKTLTDEERQILNEFLKTGSETVYRNRKKIPATYFHTPYIHQELRVNRNSQFGRAIIDLRNSFESGNDTIPDRPGVGKHHVGKPRLEVFKSAMDYLEKFVLPTADFEALRSNIERVMREQLEIQGEDFSIRLGLPSPGSFLDNLDFLVREYRERAELPVGAMGSGFIALFAVAVLRALAERDTNEGRIYLIEEPETYLHEHYQAYYYSVLRELAAENQVILTTHSKKFVDVFEPSSIVRLQYSGRTGSARAEGPGEVPPPPKYEPLQSPRDFAKYLRTLEPNIGNIAFSTKVVAVEGPLDLLAYRTVLESSFNLDLHNIGIVSAWGKDTLSSVVRMCQALGVPVFVVHDWDLADPDCDVREPPGAGNKRYEALSKEEKAQYTKNHNLLTLVGPKLIHANKRNLEAVLEIPAGQKSTASVFERVRDVDANAAVREFPRFLPAELLQFVRR